MSHSRSSLQLTLLYLVLAILWVFFSDRLVIALHLPVAQAEVLIQLKKLIFVLFNGVLLYLMSGTGARR